MTKFFTDNDHYAAYSTLKEAPRLGLQTHLSRNFTPSFWLSAGLFYARQGKTGTDGIRAIDGDDIREAGFGGQWRVPRKNGVSFPTRTRFPTLHEAWRDI